MPACTPPIPILQIGIDAVLRGTYQGPSEATCYFSETTPNQEILSLCGAVSVSPGGETTCTVLGRDTPGSYNCEVECDSFNNGTDISVLTTINVERVVPMLVLTGDATAAACDFRTVAARAFLPGSPEVALGGYQVTFSITSGSGSLSSFLTSTEAAQAVGAVGARASTLTATTFPNGYAYARVTSNQAGVVVVGASLQVGSVSIPSAPSGANFTFASVSLTIAPASPLPVRGVAIIAGLAAPRSQLQGMIKSPNAAGGFELGPCIASWPVVSYSHACLLCSPTVASSLRLAQTDICWPSLHALTSPV